MIREIVQFINITFKIGQKTLNCFKKLSRLKKALSDIVMRRLMNREATLKTCFLTIKENKYRLFANR